MPDKFETIVTRGMSDRDLMLSNNAKLDQVIEHMDEQNGKVRDLVADYYGDRKRSIKGSKQQTEENTSYIDRDRTVKRTLLAVVGVIGAGNLVALLSVL